MKSRFEYCEDSEKSLAYFNANQGHSGGITIARELMGHIFNSLQLARVCVSQGSFLQHSNRPWERTHCRRKTKRGGTTDHLLDTSQPFREKIQMKKHPMMTLHFPRKCAVTAIGNVIRCRLLGSISKSRAIIVHNPVPAVSMYKVISQKGDRTLFGRLSTPRPVPKVTLKTNWHSQQQQQPLSGDAPSSSGRPVAVDR